MKTIQFTTHINAPKEKVWDLMLSDESYREWTQVFNPGGSYFEGEWKEGAEMRFIGPDQEGNTGGMFARIKALRPYEFVSIEHLGEINNEEVKLWPKQEKDALENYTFTEKDGGTELTVDLTVVEEYVDMFNEMWPKALEKLKAMAER
jgi:uncharacterized protein YndB with AHSA1/START domain